MNKEYTRAYYDRASLCLYKEADPRLLKDEKCALINSFKNDFFVLISLAGID